MIYFQLEFQLLQRQKHSTEQLICNRQSLKNINGSKESIDIKL